MMDSCNYVNDKKNGFHYRWDDSKNNELAEKKFFKDGRYMNSNLVKILMRQVLCILIV